MNRTTVTRIGLTLTGVALVVALVAATPPTPVRAVTPPAAGWIGAAGRLPHDATTTTSTTSSTTTSTTSSTTTTSLPNRPQQGKHRWKVGWATWYRWHPGQCAVSYLHYGVYIKVTSRRTGRHVWCKVTDSQPYSKTRVVDLSTQGFSKLAPLSRGMEPVIVTW
jgi:rare lipoprotein A (peptidoglycan hydrolase)